jgi:ABC-type transport system substrate-binding protein
MFTSDQLYTSAGNTTNSNTQVRFINGNGLVGNISTAGSGTAYATSSDYRLKENVVYDWDATTRLKQLKPARFNFIADADTTVDGFLAHEAQAVVPEAVTGTKDEIDDNGDAVMQGIDQSKLVPLLVKTIQELEARITDLEG